MEPLHIYSLPNEVFVQILTPLSTQSLLRLTTVSQRFHALVLRILHYRILQCASLKEYKLMLECFHPSSKLTEPHVFCKYLGTDGLSDRYEGEDSLYENVGTAQKLGRLTSLYSRFRPEATVEERSSGTRLVPSSGMAPALGIVGSMRADYRRDGGDQEQLGDEARPVTRAVNLDGAEDFSQLCVVVNLVKVMPGSHLLLSAVTIEDGVVRLWRDWLRNQARNLKGKPGRGAEEVDEEIIIPGGGTQSRRTVDESSTSESHRMLWVDGHKNVGLKLRVREKKWNVNAPILVHEDDERQVDYEVDIEELHIRTTQLLLTTEQSIQEQQNQTKAVIFGAQPPRTGVTLMM